MKSRTLPKLLIRLPEDVKAWLVAQAAENASSQSSEIVRAIRERMKRGHNSTTKRGNGEPFPAIKEG